MNATSAHPVHATSVALASTATLASSCAAGTLATTIAARNTSPAGPALRANQDAPANQRAFLEDLLINGIEQRIPVPMAVQWTAGVRRIAALARHAGGFTTFRASPLIRSRMQFTGIDDVYSARLQVLRLRNELIGLANTMNPMLAALGGGCKDITVHARQCRPQGARLEVELIVEVPDSSDGRALDMMIARMAPLIEQLTQGTRNRTSTSGIADDRQLLCAQVALDAHCFALAPQQTDALAARIVDLHRHICTTPGRMAMHNAGIVRVVNSMLTSTPTVAGHSSVWTAQNDNDAPLCIWYRDHRGRLCGRIALPLITTLAGHGSGMPTATTGVPGILQANHAIAAIGLAHSLASLHADAGTATQPQAGLHAHDLAVMAGARDDEIATLARSLHNAEQIRCDYAIELLDRLRRQ